MSCLYQRKEAIRPFVRGEVRELFEDLPMLPGRRFDAQVETVGRSSAERAAETPGTT